MYTLSEIVVLALVFALAPIFVWTLTRLDLRDKGFIVVAIVAISISEMATVVEGYWLPDLFNTLEHALEPVVAIAFALFAIRLLRRSLVQQGGKR